VPIQVLHVGLGPIGAGIVKGVAARRGLKIVGAVDIDPAKAGRDLGQVCGLGRRLRVRVSSHLSETITATRPDIAVLCTGSVLADVYSVFEAVLKHKVPIVSTTEELAYPTARTLSLSKKIDALAKRARVAVLGTGVNPGFAMDALPIALTAVCERVEAIEVDRVQDAAIRRLPFQQKIGVGLSEQEFAAGVAEGRVGHVGLPESIAMIADAMGWKLDRVTGEITPHVTPRPIANGALAVPAGHVAGLVQDAAGFMKGRAVVRLHMAAYLGAADPHDSVRIAGTPPIAMTIAGGIHGDIATAAIVVNSIPKVVRAPPGLRTMRDMVLPGWG
jgi:4-hydroxy-tetrahydrodipicolinate reductase